MKKLNEELKRENDAQEKEIRELKAKIAELEKKL